MARASENRFRIVTLDGQVMNAGGSMTGGSTTKSAGVLSRANDLARLEGERAKQSQQLESLQKQLSEAASSAAKTEFELSAVRQQLREAEDEVLRRTEEEKQAAALRDAMEANLASIDAELQRIEARNGGDGGRLDMLRAQGEQLDVQLAALETELLAAQSALEAAGAQQAALNEQTAQLRAELAAKDAERTGAETSIAQLEALAEAMAGDREQKLQLIEDCNAQIAALREQQAAQAAAVNALAAQTEEKRKALQEAVEHRTQLEGRRNQTEKQAQDKNKEILNLERETARLEQRKLTSEMEEKQLIDKLWDSYELTPSTAEAEKIEIESIPAANKKITETRRKISSLGTPNLGAIDEFARVNERYEYLTGQRDDVLHAKDDLLQIIDGLTTEMTEIFVREFAKINEYSGEVAQVTGKKNTTLSGSGVLHLNGVQATAYARIRKLAGDDYKRTERQRTVIEAMITKVQKSGVTTINSVVDEVFDDISTNITPKQMLSLGSHALSYKMVDNSGFPFELKTKNMGKRGDCVIPLDLETNVIELHEYLFGSDTYTPTDSVKEKSKQIINDTGYTKETEAVKIQ